MKLTYEYLHFEELPTATPRTTKIWACKNNKHGFLLGWVEWEVAWRQYCFLTNPVDDEGHKNTIVLSSGCMQDIAEFLQKVNLAHKESKHED
jgi:hypothetical protein